MNSPYLLQTHGMMVIAVMVAIRCLQNQGLNHNKMQQSTNHV